MSNMVSRDHCQCCRKLFWSSFGALVPLSPYHTSVVLLVGHLQQKQKHDGYVKSVWAWFAMLDRMQVCAGVCTDVCRQTCACSTCAVGDHVCKSQFEGVAMLIWCALLMPQTWCANKAKQLLDETFLICLCAMEQQQVCLQKIVWPHHDSKLS